MDLSISTGQARVFYLRKKLAELAVHCGAKAGIVEACRGNLLALPAMTGVVFVSGTRRRLIVYRPERPFVNRRARQGEKRLFRSAKASDMPSWAAPAGAHNDILAG
jgi:hypothetical protein